MAKLKLSSYIKRIEAKYVIAREKYEVIAEKIKAEEEAHNSLDRSKYSLQGLQEIQEAHREKIRSLKDDLIAVQNVFGEEANAVIKDSDSMFNRKYCYTPADIDNNGLVILEKGVLNDSDIIKMADDYLNAGNSTMYFLYADTFKDSQDDRLYNYYLNAHNMRTNRPDHILLNNMVDMCKAGLRVNTYYSENINEGITASNAVNRKHEEWLSNVIKEADTIAVEVSNPWE